MTETMQLQQPGELLGGPFLDWDHGTAYVRRTAARRYQIARPEPTDGGLWAATLAEVDLDAVPESEQREAVEATYPRIATFEELRSSSDSEAEADLEVAWCINSAGMAQKRSVTRPSNHPGCERDLRLAIARWDSTGLGCNPDYRAAREIEALSYLEAEADGVLGSLEALHPAETASRQPIFRLPTAGPLYKALVRNLDKRGKKILEVEGYHSKDGYMYFMAASLTYPDVNRSLCLGPHRGPELLHVCREAEVLERLETA